MKGKAFVNFLAYIAIMMVAVALILGFILSKVGANSTVIDAMNIIAQVIAYAITGVFAFYYAKSKRNIWFMVAYVIAIILIIIFVIL